MTREWYEGLGRFLGPQFSLCLQSMKHALKLSFTLYDKWTGSEGDKRNKRDKWPRMSDRNSRLLLLLTPSDAG